MERLRIFFILLVAVAAAGCSKDAAEPKCYSGDVVLSSSKGEMSVFVECEGGWYVSTSADWLKLDHGAAMGNAAFTISYGANVPSSNDSCIDREATVTILKSDKTEKVEMKVTQRGLNGSAPEVAGSSINGEKINLEYRFIVPESLTVLYCNSEGLSSDEDLQTWAEGLAADLAVINSSEFSIVGNTAFVFAEFDCSEGHASYLEQMKSLVSSTIGSRGDITKWFITGSFYFKSMMEVSCKSTPQWYPSSIYDEEFEADRYAWSSRLSDCVFLKYRDFTPTWSDGQRQWRADYVYATPQALESLLNLEVLPVPVSGMTHSPIKFSVCK